MQIVVSFVVGVIAGGLGTYFFQYRIIEAGKKAIAAAKAEEQSVVNKLKRIG